MVEAVLPVFNDDSSSCSFGTDEHSVGIPAIELMKSSNCFCQAACVPIIPTSSESERRIEEAANEVRDGDTTHGEIGDHLSEDVHDAPDDDHHGDMSMTDVTVSSLLLVHRLNVVS